MIKIGSWAIPRKLEAEGTLNQVGQYCSYAWTYLWHNCPTPGGSFLERSTTAYGLMFPTISYIRDYLLRD